MPPLSAEDTPDAADPSSFVLDPEDVENELVHIDDQLITIEDNLDVISDEFIHLDHELATHIDREGGIDLEDLDPVDLDAMPYDEWMVDDALDLAEMTRVLTRETENLLDSVSESLWQFVSF